MAKASSSAAGYNDHSPQSDVTIVPKDTLEEGVHVVLLGDSTLDNGRYLNLAKGELSVEKQLMKICMDRNWDMTVLAQDGSLLDDVRQRQVPLIPEGATHIVISASGNDLLSLLNQMVVANFTMRSMYATIGTGLQQVADDYRAVIDQLKKRGCHLAICTIYQPNFNHMFFKSLASFSLGLHNSRIKQISVDLDCSVIEFSSMFDSEEDFANPLELSTRGGSKAVENIAAFVIDNPMQRFPRRRNDITTEDDSYGLATAWGLTDKCCATRNGRRKIYASKAVPKHLLRPDEALAQDSPQGPALLFSQGQERWRNMTGPGNNVGAR